MSGKCNISGVDGLIVAIGNTEVDPEGPTGKINRLVEQFAASKITDTESSEGLEEEDITLFNKLLALAGMPECENVKIEELAKEIEAFFNQLPLPQSQVDFGKVPGDLILSSCIQEGTSEIDKLFQDAIDEHLASLEDRASVRERIKARYAHFLNASYGDLQNEKLPIISHELQELSEWMAEEVEKGTTTVFSPKTHPCYPMWLSNHPSNDIIRG